MIQYFTIYIDSEQNFFFFFGTLATCFYSLIHLLFGSSIIVTFKGTTKMDSFFGHFVYLHIKIGYTLLKTSDKHFQT